MGRNKSDHDVLVRIDANMGFTKEKIIDITTRMEKLENDIKHFKDVQNVRIRKIEQWQWKTMGAASVLAVVIGVFIGGFS